MDHRDIGSAQELFFFDKHSPGSCFWLENGVHIYNTLQKLMRREFAHRGFSEVRTPIIAKNDLWITSGHWKKYRTNMFTFQCDSDDTVNKEKDEPNYALCAMNCPKHCLIFMHKARSYRELPLRFYDFGNLHRNELSGTLTGLTRVRQFCQDDAHIFCTQDQVKTEIANALEFIRTVYGVFGLQISMIGLSTRPDDYMGELDLWNRAEDELKQVLSESHIPFKINEKDGAFYGPKIDITLTDSHGRNHQCATIQLDFQLPINFKLTYVNDQDKFCTPVIIHRAIYGSYERFIAILTEHYNGKWPVWLSPFQVAVIPVASKFVEYAQTVHSELTNNKIRSKLFDSELTLSKNIHLARNMAYNYMVVVGQKEQDSQKICVRDRDNFEAGGTMCTTMDLVHKIKKLVPWKLP